MSPERTSRRFRTVLTLLLGCASLAAQTVHVVDQVNGPFLDVQSAVDAAADGDTVLVRAGSYAPAQPGPLVTITARDITVIADPAAVLSGGCLVGPVITISNVGAGQRVVLRGLTLMSDDPAGPALQVSNCQGGVLIEDCVVRYLGWGLWCSPFFSTTLGVLNVSSCARVAIRGGMIGEAGFLANPNYPGLVVSGSNVSVHSCLVFGGTTGDPNFQALLPDVGGTGLRALAGSFVFLSGCTVQGGLGGDADCSQFGFPPADGGAGIEVAGGSQVHWIGTTVSGGAGGSGGTCPDGNPGPPFLFNGGSVNGLTGTPRQSWITSPTRDNGTLQVWCAGLPGDQVTWHISSSQDHLWVPFAAGVLVPAFPPISLSAGVTDASGLLNLSLPLGDLGPGVDLLTVLFQASFIEAGSGAIHLGEPSELVVVDQQF